MTPVIMLFIYFSFFQNIFSVVLQQGLYILFNFRSSVPDPASGPGWHPYCLSAWWGLLVPGMGKVSPGDEMMYFKKNLRPVFGVNICQPSRAKRMS